MSVSLLIPASGSSLPLYAIARTATNSLLATLLCLCALSAQASEMDSLAWACWIGDQYPISINCIHDRSQLYQVTPDDPDDEAEAEVLDHIYERIISGKTAGLGDFVKKYGNILNDDAVRFIDIWSYPDEDSWKEKAPQRLVVAGLCHGSARCKVTLQEPFITIKMVAAKQKTKRRIL